MYLHINYSLNQHLKNQIRKETTAMSEKIIPIFRVEDGEKTALWYKRLGFSVIGEHRFAPDMPLYLFLERNGEELHLSEHAGDAKGPSLIYFWVEELESIAKEFGVKIEQQPWAQEIKIIDPDGNRLRIALKNSGTDT